MVLSSVMFLVTVRAAGQGAHPMHVGGLLAVWSALYAVTSLVMAWVAGRRSAAWLMVASCAGSIGISLAFLGGPGLAGMYALMAFQGIASAMFFAPFQVFMKCVDEGGGRSVAASSGLYVWAWSTGFAIGPFVTGYLWQSFGWNVCHLVNAGVAALVGAGVLWLRHYAHTQVAPAVGAPAVDPAPVDERDYAGLPDLAWMAWVFGGVGCMIISLIRGALPLSGEFYGISKASQGNVFAILSGVQALVGLSLGRFRFWAYRPLPLLVFGLIGCAGLWLLALGRSTPMFALGAACVGIHSGSFYFYFVFHSLVHPERSARYVSVNEAVVGVMGVLGPVLGGWVIQGAGLSGAYLGCAGLVLLVVLVQTTIHMGVRQPGRDLTRRFRRLGSPDAATTSV